MVPSPPQRSGTADSLPIDTWFEGYQNSLLVNDIQPVVSSNSTIRIVVNGVPSDIQPLQDNTASILVGGEINTVATADMSQEGVKLEFKFDKEFKITSFELYIDSVKANLTFQ